MKKWFGTAVLALPLLAVPANAQFTCPPVKVSGGANVNFNVSPGFTFQLGPWYQYWPLEAHFQAPAMCHYPYWPSAQTLPGVVPVQPQGLPPSPAPPVPLPPPALKPANFHAPTFQPVGYYPQAPGYWYNDR